MVQSFQNFESASEDSAVQLAKIAHQIGLLSLKTEAPPSVAEVIDLDAEEDNPIQPPEPTVNGILNHTEEAAAEDQPIPQQQNGEEPVVNAEPPANLPAAEEENVRYKFVDIDLDIINRDLYYDLGI